MLFEYYLTGGEIRIGKKEAALELLRSGSALRFLLAYGAGDLKSLLSNAAGAASETDTVVIDLGRGGERRLSDDPTQTLKELKRRYGAAVGGKLYFRLYYTPWKGNIYVETDLDDDTVSQTLNGFM